MRKIMMMLAVFLCCAMTAQAQLLYKISGGGLAEPSYIMGTHHFAAISFVDSIPGLRRVMNETQQVYGELERDTTELSKELMDMMFMPEGTKFASLFTADEMERLIDFAFDSCHVKAEGIEQLFDFKPAGVKITLMLKYEGYQNTHYDEYFQKEALAQGKIIGGLETTEFQFKMLLEAPTLERQKEQLMCLVDDPSNSREKGTMLRDYYAQDLETMWNTFIKSVGNPCSLTPEEKVLMLDDRNKAWMKMIPSLMRHKSTLFVVGALHLPGPDGVLNLLRQAGYTVEAVTQ